MKNNNGSVLSHSCRGLKIRVTAIVFVIFLLSAQTLAQVQSSNRVKLVTPISDEQQINTILEEVVQGTRSNESERIATFIGSQSERAQVRNQLADAFKQGRDINRNIASVFSFDSMRVTIAGDSAQVMCLVGDQIEKKASTTLLLKKEMGRWYISHSSDIVERIADFVKSNGFPSRQPSNS
jgi:predicted Co/Zn/Cd cation transporter (cation efflux family)